MINKCLFVDRTSVGWEHKDFNINYMKNYALKHNSFFNAYLNEEIGEISKWFLGYLNKKPLFSLIFFIIKNRPKLIFLCMTKKDYLLALFVSTLTDVSFVVHKYNLNANKHSVIHRVFYRLANWMNITPLFQDEYPLNCFEGVSDNINPFEEINNSGIDYNDNYVIKRILFVGSATSDKAPNEAMTYAASNNYCLLQLCDKGPRTLQMCDEIIPLNRYKFEFGDVVWGCYNLEEYHGVQSGLPFFSMIYNLPILVESTNCFLKFSQFHKNYLIMKK